MIKKKSFLVLTTIVLLMVMTACGGKTVSEKVSKIADAVSSAKTIETEVKMNLRIKSGDDDYPPIEFTMFNKDLTYLMTVKNDFKSKKAEVIYSWEQNGDYDIDISQFTNNTFYDFKK